MTADRLRFLLAGSLTALCFGVAACGGDDDEETSGTGNATTTQQADAPEGKKGGKLTMLAASDTDYLDPQHTYYTFGFMIQTAINRALYTFSPDDPLTPEPDLAEGEPEISTDKKTVTVKLKTGIKYAPPVDREVKADDIKYAFERFFSENVGGQYPGYFNMIEGAPKKPSKGVHSIKGIETPDDQTVVFNLNEPVAVSFAAALVMPISVAVPQEYARKFDRKSPSTYNTNIAMTGPYMIENNAEGKLTGYKAGKSIKLVRNPNWDPETDFRPALLDEILIKTNVTNADVAARQILSGQSLVLDTNPPANILKTVATRQKDQLLQVPSGGFRWFPINTTIKPFDDLNVRKAVLAGFDREAAVKARGGKFVGDVATHFLPPNFPGFEEAGGMDGAGVDFLSQENAGGDDELAAEYMKKAGYASGKYDGDETFLMVTANVDPGKAQAQVAERELEELGFKVKLRLVPQDAVYTEWCQVPAKKVLMCGSAGWFKDFNDPQSMLEPTLKGEFIMKDGGNNNLPQLDDPAIDKAMDEAALLEGEERLKAWGEIDKMIVNQAPAIPFIWDKTNLIFSKNVAPKGNPYYALWDLTHMSLK